MKNNKDGMHFMHAANHVGLFFMVLFAICFAWYFIMPVERELHMSMFRMSFFAFDGMNLMGFISGLVQVYIWAYIFVGAWFLVGRCRCGCGCSCKK